MDKGMKERIRELFNQIELPVSDAQLDAFAYYADELLRWNETRNLTGITDPDGIAEKHFLDSVLLLKCLEIPEGALLLDLGTGAGFPGIPLKIMRPDLRFILLDSLRKRVEFLEHICGELGLADMDCVHERAEILARNKNYREKADIVVTRAVSSLPVLMEYGAPFLKLGGTLAAYKGNISDEEKNASSRAMEVLSFVKERESCFTLPLSNSNRIILTFKKTAATPARFPRKPGTAEKKPL